MEGWIKLYRKLENHWIAENNDYFHWWCDLLFLASYSDKTKTVHSPDNEGNPKDDTIVVLRRGQIEASVAFLVKRWMLNRKTLDRKTVMRFLSLLEEDGMIKREVKDGVRAIITITNYDTYQGTNRLAADTSMDDLADILADIPTDTIKEYIKKERTKNKPPKGGKEKNKPSFSVDPAFEEVFSLWLEYKKQKGQTYKGEKSLKVCYNKLVELSGNNPDTAMAIVKQSMANNWSGIFELKDNKNGNNSQQQNRQSGQVSGWAQAEDPLAGAKIFHA